MDYLRDNSRNTKQRFYKSNNSNHNKINQYSTLITNNSSKFITDRDQPGLTGRISQLSNQQMRTFHKDDDEDSACAKMLKGFRERDLTNVKVKCL